MGTRCIGIIWESHKDNGEDSEQTDWGLVFMVLKNRGFSHEEILKLSYPQLNAYMQNLYNQNAYQIIIPYLGSSEDDKEPIKVTEKNKITSRDELMAIVNSMNNDFK